MTLQPRQFDFWGGSVPYGHPAAPEADTGLQARLARRERNRVDVVASAMLREDPENVAKTTDFGLIPASESNMPKGAAPYEHPHAVRRMVGHPAEVPLAGLKTPQGDVSVPRVNELVHDPSAGQNPRFPAKLMVDVPFVYRSHSGINTLLDGNHRVAAAITRGEMFTPARVITDRSMPAMRRKTREVHQRRANLSVGEFDRYNRYTSE